MSKMGICAPIERLHEAARHLPDQQVLEIAAMLVEQAELLRQEMVRRIGDPRAKLELAERELAKHGLTFWYDPDGGTA